MIPLLSTAASAADAKIYKKTLVSGSQDTRTTGSGITTLTISNEEVEDIMEIVKSFQDSGLSIKGVIQAIENKPRKQRG